MEKITTIKVKESVKKRIGRLKIHPRESYNDVLDRISKAVEISRKNPELGIWEALEILEADERTKRGQVYTEDETRRILGI